MAALIVDRDVGSCLVLRKMMSAHGYQCDIVQSIHDGLQKAMLKEYSLIIVGCFVGDNSCWVTSQAIKLLPRKGPCPPVIGILSISDSEMERRCSEMAFEGVLVKPVSKSALSQCIDRVRATRCAEPEYCRVEKTNLFKSSSENSIFSASCRQSKGKILLSALEKKDLSTCDQEIQDRHLDLGELNRPCSA
jgi:DNA-binding response OmpR family regulator